ncbi:hypothetical protein GCM10025787_35720 [Saccharopolyspora rosea]
MMKGTFLPGADRKVPLLQPEPPARPGHRVFDHTPNPGREAQRPGAWLDAARIGGVLRSLLTPRWLLLHVLFVVAAIATGFLAVWQWDRAHEAGGSFQNLGYALQWPLFGAFVIFFWIRLMRMELQRAPAQSAASEQPPEEPQPEEVAESTSARKRPLVPPPAPPVSDDEDPELAAYNRYLAELNETDQGR